MSGTGTTTIAAGAIMDITGSSTEVLDTRTCINSGTVNWTGSGGMSLADGGVFNNRGTFNDRNDHTIYASGATGMFNNAGTFTRSPTTGATTVYDLFNNTGTVAVTSGTLALLGGGSDTGSFVVPVASTLSFSGMTGLGSASSVTGAGAVGFAGGTADVTGTYDITGSTSDAGAVNFVAGSGTFSLGQTLTVTGGTTYLGRAAGLSLTTLNLSGGTLTGPENITVTGTGAQCNWSNATMSGTGTTTIAAGAIMDITGSSTEVLDTRTCTNSGTVNWTGTGSIFLADGAVFNNKATFNDRNDHTISLSGATGTFNNAGTFTKSPTTGTTTLFVSLNNSGTVNVTSGSLFLNGGGTGKAGSYTVASGSTLDFAAGNFGLDSACTMSGAGALVMSGGSLDMNGTTSITGPISVAAAGTVNFIGNATVGTFTSAGNVTIGTGSTFTVSAGNYTQTGSSSVTSLNGGVLRVAGGNKIDLQAGTFSGLGTVTGSFSNAGTLVIGGAGTVGVLAVSGNYTQTSSGVLDLDLGGPLAGTQYDQLNVGGTATLAGTLNAGVINGYVPATNTVFTIMTYASASGNFATLNLNGGIKTLTATKGSTAYTLRSS
jgi:hypothetical protein